MDVLRLIPVTNQGTQKSTPIYSFRAKVYLKGVNPDSAGYVSIEVEQVSDFEHDRINVWPMIGKLITVGITEQEKELG